MRSKNFSLNGADTVLLWIGQAGWEQKDEKATSVQEVLITSSSIRENMGSKKKDLKDISEILCFLGIFSVSTFDLIPTKEQPLATA